MQAHRAEGAPELLDAAPEAGRLDLHEGIGDPGGCGRWPEALRLANLRTGELVRGRCRATNLCAYCRVLYTVETVEMWALDAAEYAPTVWVVLTAREHLTRGACRDHLRQLRKVARDRWPGIEWAVSVEFQRRGALHLNLLVKGVPASAAEDVRLVLGERWCSRVDALMKGQWAGSMADAGGVICYLNKQLSHGLKVEQAPPIGWKGHRTSQTRGYLVRPASAMREEARAALKLKRLLYGGRSLEVATAELENPDSWRLVGHVGRDLEAVQRDAARRPLQLLAALRKGPGDAAG